MSRNDEDFIIQPTQVDPPPTEVEPTATGLRRRKALGTFASRKEAQAAERKALKAKDRGTDLSAKTCTVSQPLDRFVADRRAIRTVIRYEEIAKHSIGPHVGSLVLTKITPTHVSAWLATLHEKGSVKKKPLAPKSFRRAFALLSAALCYGRLSLRWRFGASLFDGHHVLHRHPRRAIAPRRPNLYPDAQLDFVFVTFFGEVIFMLW